MSRYFSEDRMRKARTTCLIGRAVLVLAAAMVDVDFDFAKFEDF